MTDTVLDRLLRYVVLDTQSDARSPTQPSTAKQLVLGRLLVDELQAIGLTDAHLDDYGYVYATIPGNSDKQVPVICFCSHMDTAPDFTGTNVKPQLVRDYQGGDIVLPGDPGRVIRESEHPALKDQIGHDIVTTDGTTLLGADNKAGVAEIVSLAAHLMAHPEVRRGTVKILFTPDEEIARGVDKVDMAKLGARFGYTVDGETIGWIEDETFSADKVDIVIHGVATHPGFAYGKMENAIRIAGAVIAALPKDIAPETTRDRDGFIHPTGISGAMEMAELSFIIRDFTETGLVDKEIMLEGIVKQQIAAWAGSTYTFTVTEQYRNMKSVLDRNPEIVEHAIEAIRRVGLEPKRGSVRGGTDGSRLSFMGLPCPNIFTGGHAYHSPLEWVSRQDMETAVATLVELVKVWEERA